MGYYMLKHRRQAAPHLFTVIVLLNAKQKTMTL